MARPVTPAVRVSLFCEDIAHESTARALCERIAEEEGRVLDLTVASARLGIPRLQRELRARCSASSAAGPARRICSS